MAARFWVGGTGTWDATTTANWSATSGGAGGASVPGAADDVTINTASITVTTDYNVSVISVTINASAATLSLGGTLTCSGALTVTQGTFTTNDYNVTATSLSSSNSNTRTINLGSSTVTLTSGTNTFVTTTITGLTFNAGTSTIIVSGANAIVAGGGTSAAGVTFYNVSFTATTAGTYSIGGINTFNNLTVTGPAAAGVTQVTFDSRTTINGTLSTTGTAGNRRVWFQGSTYGIAQTLAINSAPSLTDADFRDIYVIGTAAPISGTRIGDLRGIRGITASTPKTVYWNLAGAQNWSANGWSDTSTGTPNTDFFPLAQDTATFTNAGSVTGTITLNTAIPYTGTVDMSGRTSAMTIGGGNSFSVYGNWITGSGVTNSTTNQVTFSGRNTQTITSAGKTFSGGIIVDSYGGLVELADALNTVGNNFQLNNGSFDTKNFNFTTNSLLSNNSNVRTIIFGSSTITITSTALTFTTSTNLTLNAGTSQINLSTTSAFTFNGGGMTFYNVSFTGTTATTHVIVGANTFNNFTLTAPASAGLMQCTFAANQTINGTLTVAGASPVRRIFLRSNTLGTTRTLTVNSLSATDCDFRDITIAGTAAGSSPTRAGDCGGNTGVTFPAAKTVYWNLSGAQTWSATAWAPGSGGVPDINNFPLAQDTAVFDEAAGSVTGTITINAAWNIGTFDASLRTSAMTLTGSIAVQFSVYGNWSFGTGVTVTNNSNACRFLGRSASTITSNGVTTPWEIYIESPFGQVSLSDALVCNSSIYVTFGTLDAVTYNVTCVRFDFTTNTGPKTIKMGSGVWTITGASNIWLAASANVAFYKGTANIVFSDTSTTARTFVGGGLSYNKLTIGGATGTSTTTITGDNTFTELASTKTVAHTIALGTTTQTFGAWTVTGTAGNVVTLTGTGTAHILAGACTSGIDYLAMGSIGFAATSPGEFYAGANSTGTAAAPVYRTAKPADSTRYWVGGTGNWSDTARWSTSSGGGSGASVPRSHDDVVFDSLSNATAYTATVNAVTGGIRTKALTIAGPLTGNLTLAGSTAINGIHGNVTLPATGLTRTYTGAITLSGSATGKTITTNGVNLASATTINGVGAEWALGGALNISGTLSIVRGSFDCDTYNLTCDSISSNNTHSRALDFGSSTILSTSTTALTFGTTESARANLTFIAGTSQLNVSSGTTSFSGNNQTFYSVSFTDTNINTITIDGANTFNDLSVAGRTSAGRGLILITADQTINGTLTLSAGTNATARTFVQSNTIGTTRTLTCAAVGSLTDIDFRDITIAGSAAPVSGTRLGDCKGNSGITFVAGADKYWNLAAGGNWSAVGWALSSGGAVSNDNFPLAQDTCIFEAGSPNSGTTVTVNANYNIGTIDMSARTTNTMTLAGSQSPSVYGNWTNGTGVTLSGTNTLTFAGRGSQTITSAGRTFTQSFIVDTPGGSVTLQDAFETNRSSAVTVTLTQGTFDANNYNVTLSAGGFASAISGVARTINIGSGTWVINRSGAAWDTSTGSELVTIIGTGTISLISSSAKTFLCGIADYSSVTLDQGGAGGLTINSINSFANITNSYSATGATTLNFGTTTQRVANFTATGTAGNVLTIQGTSATSPCTLIYTGAGNISLDYVTITGVRAYSLTDTWYAGANSTNNGSLGWIFAAGSVVASFFGNFFFFF
jgi:hypothetical protein